MAVVNYDRSSVYYRTPQSTTYLGYWIPPTVGPASTDVLIELTPRYEGRPDLLSFDLYGTPRLWWTFSLVNPDLLKDPLGDMKAGLQIYVPTKTSVLGYL
jgi:hypothetical protein